MNRMKIINLLYLLIGLVLVAIALKVSQSVLDSKDSLFIYVELLWLPVFIYFVFLLRNSTLPRIIMICLSSALFGLILTEGYLLLARDNPKTNTKKIRTVFDPKVQAHRRHEFLGALPLENNKYSRAKYYGDELIYDVTYTIDEHGMRVSPPISEADINRYVIFLGCSFTYGEGVQDNETMPYQVGKLSDGKHKIFNMGFSGNGPHQMLSALEHGRVEDIVGKSDIPKVFIYQSIYDQIRRTVRPVFWDYNSPRYVLNKSAEIEYTGSFIDNSLFSFEMLRKLRRSLTYKKIFERRKKISDSDIYIYVNIISKSRDEIYKLYPGSKFHIIHWDNESIDYEQTVLKEYESHDLNVHLVSDIISDFNKNRSKYFISKREPHPNAKAYQIIANYVSMKILTNSNTELH